MEAPFQDAEIQRIAEEAKTGSIEALEALELRFRTEKTPVLIPLLPLTLVHLDPDLIPFAASNSVNANIIRAKVSLLCLASLAVNDDAGDIVLDTVLINQKRVFSWLLFLQRRYLCSYPEDNLVSFSEVAKLIHIFCAIMSFSKPVIRLIGQKSTAISKYYVDAWYRLARMPIPPSFSAMLVDSVVMAMTPFFTGIYDEPSHPSWERVNTKYVMADTAVRYVAWQSQSISVIPVCADPVDQFACMSGSVRSLACILRHHKTEWLVDDTSFVQVLMSALHVLIKRRRAIFSLSPRFSCHHANSEREIHKPTSPRGVYEARVIHELWTLLLEFISNSHGLDSIMAAYDNGIIGALLGSGSLPNTGTPVCTIFLEQILVQHMLFPKVLKALKKDLSHAENEEISLFPGKDSAHSQSWVEFRFEVKEVELLKYSASVKVKFFNSCIFARCPRQGNSGSMKQCRGCHVVRYCSAKCQKLDWPKHRVQCNLFQCARSNWDALGRHGFLNIGEYEALTDIKPAVLSTLYEEQRKHCFASANYPVLCRAYSLKGSISVRPFSSIAPLFQRRCWKRALPYLKMLGFICVFELPYGGDKVTILSPWLALSTLNRPDLFDVPPYKRRQ